MPATLLARLSPDLGTGAGFHHPLQLLQRPPRRVAAAACAVPAAAPALPWVDRLVAWAEARPVHHHLGSWMLIGR
jgi:hypothetical protein